jgi:hypothetical protein
VAGEKKKMGVRCINQHFKRGKRPLSVSAAPDTSQILSVEQELKDV